MNEQEFDEWVAVNPTFYNDNLHHDLPHDRGEQRRRWQKLLFSPEYADNTELREYPQASVLLRGRCFAHKPPTLILLVLRDGAIRVTGRNATSHLLDTHGTWGTVCDCGLWVGRSAGLVGPATDKKRGTIDIRSVATLELRPQVGL